MYLFVTNFLHKFSFVCKICYILPVQVISNVLWSIENERGRAQLAIKVWHTFTDQFFSHCNKWRLARNVFLFLMNQRIINFYYNYSTNTVKMNTLFGKIISWGSLIFQISQFFESREKGRFPENCLSLGRKLLKFNFKCLHIASNANWMGKSKISLSFCSTWSPFCSLTSAHIE